MYVCMYLSMHIVKQIQRQVYNVCMYVCMNPSIVSFLIVHVYKYRDGFTVYV